MDFKQVKRRIRDLIRDNKVCAYVPYQEREEGCFHVLKSIREAFVSPKMRFKICSPYKFGGSNRDIPWILQIVNVGCFWKDKFDTPRFEGTPYGIFGPSPRISVDLFRCIRLIVWWEAPCTYRDEDTYWEMWLWYKYYCGSDIDKARESWEWKDMEDNSTWKEEFVKH